jgi:DNA-binding MarR family transcriptional regulator
MDEVDWSKDTALRLERGVQRLRNRLRSESGMYGAGLTLTQVSVLANVLEHGPVTAARLAELQHVTPQAIAQSLTALKAAELVVSEPDPGDRRKILISAAPSARELYASWVGRRMAFLVRAMEQIPEHEREDTERAVRLLERLAGLGPDATDEGI